MNSKLCDLQEGEYIGIDVWQPLPGQRRLGEQREKEMLISNLKDNIGKGHVVLNDRGKTYVAVLLDVDFETNPNNKRYIFCYYDPILKDDITIDTLYDEGWTVFGLSA